MKSHNPYLITQQFEELLADFCGSKYAVCVESCSAAIFLSLMYRTTVDGINHVWVDIPNKTYPSVPCSIIHAGLSPRFHDAEWQGEYLLGNVDIWDAALRFKRGMYHGGLQCLSFHVKKLLPISRGGAILTDDEEAYKWLKKARFDGREPIPLAEDNFTMLGFNMYMPPSDAARGIQLFQAMLTKHPDGYEDLKVEEQGYCDLSKFKVYQQ
jgi:dTDP-4-amino-4,6-dideoxygalactose transaminase